MRDIALRTLNTLHGHVSYTVLCTRVFNIVAVYCAVFFHVYMLFAVLMA